MCISLCHNQTTVTAAHKAYAAPGVNALGIAQSSNYIPLPSALISLSCTVQHEDLTER